MEKESKRFLVGGALVAILIGSAFAWNNYEGRRDAALSAEFRAAAEDAFRAIEEAEQSVPAPVYQRNLENAGEAIEKADRAVKTTRDHEVMLQLKKYQLALMQTRDTLAFLADNGGITSKALEVQKNALVSVKTQTVAALRFPNQ